MSMNGMHKSPREMVSPRTFSSTVKIPIPAPGMVDSAKYRAQYGWSAGHTDDEDEDEVEVEEVEEDEVEEVEEEVVVDLQVPSATHSCSAAAPTTRTGTASRSSSPHGAPPASTAASTSTAGRRAFVLMMMELPRPHTVLVSKNTTVGRLRSRRNSLKGRVVVHVDHRLNRRGVELLFSAGRRWFWGGTFCLVTGRGGELFVACCPSSSRPPASCGRCCQCTYLFSSRSLPPSFVHDCACGRRRIEDRTVERLYRFQVSWRTNCNPEEQRDLVAHGPARCSLLCGLSYW